MASVRYIYPSKLLTRTETDQRFFCVDAEKAYTYADLAVAANGWKLTFTEGKIKRVALSFTTAFDTAASLLGAWAAGTVAVLTSGTDRITCGRLADGLVDGCAGEFPDDCGMLRLQPTTTAVPCRDAFDEKAPLLELFTSGTTDVPTRVIKRLEQLFSEVDGIENHPMNFTADDALIVSSVTPQHIYGLVFALLWPAASSRTIWNRRVATETELMDVVSTHDKIVWIGSTVLLNREQRDPRWETSRGHWETIITSGAVLSDDVTRRVIRVTGRSPVEIFFSSEAGGIAGRIRHLNQDGSLSSPVWVPAKNVEWKIVNGLLALKSPRQATDGWEITEDRAEASPDGRGFIYVGRADRMADLGDRQISLSALESVLAPNAFIKEAKAFMLRDERHSLAVVAALTDRGIDLLHREGKNVLALKLCNLLADVYDSTCLPQRWRFVNDLPVDSVGKTSIPALMALFEPATHQTVLVSRDKSHAVFSVTIPASSPFFKVRTKVYIIPGLQQIQLSMTLARSVFPIPTAFTGMTDMHFPIPVPADKTFDVELTYEDKPQAVRFVWRMKDELIAQGRILFDAI